MEHGIITTEAMAEGECVETMFRPQCLRDYVGQEKIKSTLDICIEATETGRKSLDHALSYGPPGLGKTTLAGITTNEVRTNMEVTSDPAIEKSGGMAAILNNSQEGDVLFVDKIYRLNRQVEEVLYPAMEDFTIDIMLGKDFTARSTRLDLPHFTLVGTTARTGLLTASLKDRFGVIQRLEFYTPEGLRVTIFHSARVPGVEIEARGAMEPTRRSRGTPRLANRLLKRVRDFVQAKHDGVTTQGITDSALDIIGVDKLGLDQNDRSILLMVIEEFSNGPVGLDTLTVVLGGDSGALKRVYESCLLMNGLISRTPRGRIAIGTAYRCLGLEIQKQPC